MGQWQCAENLPLHGGQCSKTATHFIASVRYLPAGGTATELRKALCNQHIQAEVLNYQECIVTRIGAQ